MFIFNREKNIFEGAYTCVIIPYVCVVCFVKNNWGGKDWKTGIKCKTNKIIEANYDNGIDW